MEPKLTIADASAKIRDRSLSCQTLIETVLRRITEWNGELNAVCHMGEALLSQAVSLDKEAALGKIRGPLHGIPIIVKDNIDVCGMPSTVGSAIFQNAPEAVQDAAVAARLKSAGAIILGKANMDELAAHISGITSFHGPAVNPRDLEVRRSPGGSSSGTGAALAAGFCLGGLGSDTGGSIRIPAAWCGLCGLRPTQGLFSNHGIFPRGASLDTIGLLTLDARDMLLLFEAVSGEQAFKGEPPAPASFSRLRIAVLSDFADAVLERDVREDFDRTVQHCKEFGATVFTRSCPSAVAPELNNTANIIRAFEFARDAGPFIEASPHKDAIHPLVLNDYTYGLSIDYAMYIGALKDMHRMRSELEGMFDDADLLLAPVAPMSAPPLSTPLPEFIAYRKFMNFGSMAGIPALVLPTGKDSIGLPLGVQFMGKPFCDHELIHAGIAYEQLLEQVALRIVA